MKHESTAVLNLCHAPWGSCGHLGKLKSAGEEFFIHNKSDSDLFTAFYPLLAFVLWPGVILLDFGTPEHKELVWQKARDSKILVNTYDRAQLKWWLSTGRTSVCSSWSSRTWGWCWGNGRACTTALLGGS